MRSAAWARSIVLVATAGCQRSWPLKSRSTFQTAPVGASRIVLLTMCGTLASESALERVEAALKPPSADIADEFVLPLGRAVELRGPFEERLVAIGHRSEPERCDVVLYAHGGFQDGVGAEHVVVGQPEQFLADAIAVAQAK